ncbi:ABC transporter permease [Cellulomonas soli]|uniref:Transport permease protein n=1 Tax=Cellulomonas soli TaxID=931535 RepID=A0A512P816_9CELL|nr:ABC transporter permease [Cellulomonas soli]NYI57559.1 ABC-2 type transport system permease protein [Cellulomonas soli]GEP67336.1 transport permease protein [Cellulomonas soli]
MTVSAQDRIEAVAREPFTTTGRESGWTGAWRSVVDIWGHRELLDLLVRRELKSRYKDSALGFLWSMIRPLTMLFVYYVAIGKVLNGERSIPGFAIFVFTGLTAWGLFSEIVAGGTGSIVGNSGLVKKIYLPREVFPLSVVGSALFNFAIQLSILIIATLALRQPPTQYVFTYFPVATLLLLVLGLALALMLGAANVFLRDMQYLVEVVLMVAMWASPIVYSWQLVDGKLPDGLLKDLYLSNPVTLAILAYQRSFWAEGADSTYPEDLMTRLLIALGISAVLLVIGQRVFARAEGNFAQEL